MHCCMTWHDYASFFLSLSVENMICARKEETEGQTPVPGKQTSLIAATE